MTLAMPDSIITANLPPGYPAYLGYTDGNFQTYPDLIKRFPGARIIGLTVNGHSRGADGADVEPDNLTASQAAQWATGRVAPGFRPIMYASVQGVPGYGMHEVISELAADGITRSQVRLLSAHYGQGEHICGPATCNLISTPMDGTQWTDSHPGAAPGTLIDMSALNDGFFGSETQTEVWVRQLGTVRQGDTGETVRTVQGLVNARREPGEAPLVIDGDFGTLTAAAVRTEQQDARLAVDGVVGPQTWPVLLGIA